MGYGGDARIHISYRECDITTSLTDMVCERICRTRRYALYLEKWLLFDCMRKWLLMLFCILFSQMKHINLAWDGRYRKDRHTQRERRWYARKWRRVTRNDRNTRKWSEKKRGRKGKQQEKRSTTDFPSHTMNSHTLIKNVMSSGDDHYPFLFFSLWRSLFSFLRIQSWEG